MQGDKLANTTSASIDVSAQAGTPATAAIYQLDSIVRRAPSLQLTADGLAGRGAVAVTIEEEGVPA